MYTFTGIQVYTCTVSMVAPDNITLYTVSLISGLDGKVVIN